MQWNPVAFLHAEPELLGQKFLMHEERQSEEEVAGAALVWRIAEAFVLDESAVHLISQLLYDVSIVTNHI